MCLDTDAVSNVGGWPEQSGAVVEVRLNGHSKLALLDSGANPSIVDFKSLQKIGREYTKCPSRVYGVGASPVPTLGRAEITVNIGDGNKVQHAFLVLDSNEPTIILGRDFLKKFNSVEFDWDNHRVRLGDNWIQSEASIIGGQPISRAITSSITGPANEAEPNHPDSGWKINPGLKPNQKAELLKLIGEYPDVFAIKSKKPNTTHIARHIIDTENA